jgi:hypothetical protein
MPVRLQVRLPASLITLLLCVCTALAANTARAETSASLAQALVLFEALPANRKTTTLAAEVSQEGHWTFANSKAERFTTASPEELKRVLPTLAADAAQPGVRLTLIVTGETVFRQRAHFLALPLAHAPQTDVLIAVGPDAYPLVKRGNQIFATIKPGLAIELTERTLFDETVWQLAHPLKQNSIRVIALEPGGPTSLTMRPRLDAQTKQPLTDQIAPGSLIAALRTLRAQTVILTARRDGNALAFRPSSGSEITLPLADVLAAAEAADVNLVVLQSATPRQPGTRSWLWQRVSVTRLGDAIARDHLADFLNALATPEQRLLISASVEGAGRIRLTAAQMKNDGFLNSGIGGKLNDLVSNIAGQVVISSVEASMRDSARQSELDRRIILALPSWLQYGYGLLILIGLAGHPIANTWWTRIWPPEARDSYANTFGYQSARAIRSLFYATIFMPLTALASAPLALAGRLRRAPV